MLRTLILLCSIALLSSFSKDKTIDIRFTAEKQVFINDTKIDKTTTFDQIKDLLGEPIIHKEYPTGKIMYQYPDLGIAVHCVNNNLLYFGVNYNWDGDKKFPETTFAGTLKIGEVEFSVDTKEAALQTIKVVEINCVMPGLCMTNPREEKNNIMIGFKDDLISQVGFEFH